MHDVLRAGLPKIMRRGLRNLLSSWDAADPRLPPRATKDTLYDPIDARFLRAANCVPIGT
jgi:hypothetical protein